MQIFFRLCNPGHECLSTVNEMLRPASGWALGLSPLIARKESETDMKTLITALVGLRKNPCAAAAALLAADGRFRRH